MNALPCLVLLSLLFAEDDLRDIVKLKSGGDIKGRVVFQNDDKVIVRTGGRERTVSSSDVASVESVMTSLEEVLERLRKLGNDDVAAHLDLASFCVERKLPRQASIEALHVLTLDPKNEKAHEILKHRRGENAWYVLLDGGEVSWGLVDRTTADWGKALRVESEHFSIRTDAGVRAAVDLAWDLELLYSALFQVFGADVEMREVLEPIGVNAYRNREEWPSRGGHIGGYFNTSDRTLYVYYQQIPGRPHGLFHETTHSILHMAFERERSGVIPPWVNEGMADYFQTAMQGPPGKPRLTFGAANTAQFQAVAAAAKATSLRRILNYNATDFGASSNQLLKYAECYTLVHFLVHADNEARRLKFAEYLRGAFRSKATSGRFEKALGQDLDSIEKAWRSYVAGRAR